jgi:hypothetical protein
MAKRKTVSKLAWFAVCVTWVSATNRKSQDSYILVRTKGQTEAATEATEYVKSEYVVDTIRNVQSSGLSMAGRLNRSIIDVSGIGRASWLGMPSRPTKRPKSTAGQKRKWYGVAHNWVNGLDKKNKTTYCIVYAANDIVATMMVADYIQATYVTLSLGNVKARLLAGLSGQLANDVVCVSTAKRSTRLYEQRVNNGTSIGN